MKEDLDFDNSSSYQILISPPPYIDQGSFHPSHRHRVSQAGNLLEQTETRYQTRRHYSFFPRYRHQRETNAVKPNGHRVSLSLPGDRHITSTYDYSTNCTGIIDFVYSYHKANLEPCRFITASRCTTLLTTTTLRTLSTFCALLLSVGVREQGTSNLPVHRASPPLSPTYDRLSGPLAYRSRRNTSCRTFDWSWNQGKGYQDVDLVIKIPDTARLLG